jgi:hypothetical protein
MSSGLRTAMIFAVGIVLAFVWGIYYVLLSAVGFELDLTIEFLAPTMIIIAGMVAVELYLRRVRSESRRKHTE